MAVQNSLTKQEKKVPFSVQINSKGYQTMINNTLKDRNTANRFIASIVSAVSATPALAECEAKSIVSAALLGEGLKLSPSPQLGQYYLVPFKDRKNGVTNAQFVLGYKGYIQLAIRSGQYKKLNVLPIKEGELIRFDPLNHKNELQRKTESIEQFVNGIQEYKVRRALLIYCIEPINENATSPDWDDVARRIGNGCTEASVKMSVKRFFEKIS